MKKVILEPIKTILGKPFKVPRLAYIRGALSD